MKKQNQPLLCARRARAGLLKEEGAKETGRSPQWRTALHPMSKIGSTRMQVNFPKSLTSIT
jgi:hypothetical protein